jgi:hypothetical protein
MASVFKLTRNAVDLNLLQAQNAGWRAEEWFPRVALITGNRMPPLVTETVDLLGDATSHDALATDFQDLDNYRWLARQYIQDRTQQHPVWLHAKTNAETNERRALVHDIELAWRSDEVDENGKWINDNTARVRANIVRGPFWEDTAANTKTAGSNISVLGGVYDYSGTDVVGDAPARINYLTLKSDDETYTKAWIGFRSANKHGTLGNFRALWECEDATAIAADCALANSATASPGGAGNTEVNCDFSSSAAWAWRLWWDLDELYTTNYSDMYGRFVILLRAKVDASTTCEVRLRQHYVYGTYNDGPIVEVASTSWTIYNLGTISIPIRDLHAMPLSVWIDDYDGAERYAVWARRTSGTGDIDFDCVMAIPADELFIYADDLYTSSTANVYRSVIAQSPEGLWRCLSYYDTTVDVWYGNGPVSAQGIGVPVGDGRMYAVLAQSDNTNTFDDTYDTTLSLFPRFYNLRGSE